MTMNEFPQFRRYTNQKSYFKISASDSLLETQVIGQRFDTHQLKAKILPERNFIADLLTQAHEGIEVISEKEYLDFITYCKDQLSPI